MVYLGLSPSGSLNDADTGVGADYDPDNGVDADSRNIIPPVMIIAVTAVLNIRRRRRRKLV